MSFKFNGVGNFSIPTWNAGTGDYLVTGAFQYPSTGAFEVMLSGATTTHIAYTDTGGTFKLKHGTTITINGLVGGQNYWYEESRTVNTVTLNIYDYPAMTLVGTGTSSYGGTSFPYDSFGATSIGGFDFTGEMAGTWTFTNTGSTDVRTYEFDQSIGTVDLPETTSSQTGTKANGNNGDYTGSGLDGISITSHTDGQFVQRDDSLGNKLITLSGEILGTAATTVEVRLDFGDWVLLDASPTTTYSGTVTVNNTQYVQIRGTGVDTTSAVVKIIVGAAIPFIGDSNQFGYGINTQLVNKSALAADTLMYNGSNTLELEDPTASGAGGSILPRVAKLYADSGTSVLFYNIGRSGTMASDWQKGGADYDKLNAFFTLTGGFELVTVQLGINDAANSISQVSFTADMNAIVNDIFTDFGCKTYLTRFASSTIGSAGSRAAILAGIDDAVATNTNAEAGGDFTGIDITTATNALNDNIHFKLDADLTTAANLVYAANTYVTPAPVFSSNAPLTVTGIPNGSYLVNVFTDNRPTELLTSEVVTFTSGIGNVVVPVGADVKVYGLVRDNLDPSISTAPIEAITEAIVA